MKRFQCNHVFGCLSLRKWSQNISILTWLNSKCACRGELNIFHHSHAWCLLTMYASLNEMFDCCNSNRSTQGQHIYVREKKNNALLSINWVWLRPLNDVIISEMASQITGVSIVYLTVSSGADRGKHQSSTSLAFVLGIHRLPVIPGTKGQ